MYLVILIFSFSLAGKKRLLKDKEYMKKFIFDRMQD